jgi:DNA-directed RNA polymerase subunit RPC12/RpoP
MEHSEEWKALALKYFYEVCLLGYAAIDDHSVTITPSGKGVLLEARGDGFEKDFWVFVEKCLHETVAVDCPYCGTENLTNFYWNSYECAECGKIARLGQSAYLAVRKTGEHTAYTNSIEFY